MKSLAIQRSEDKKAASGDRLPHDLEVKMALAILRNTKLNKTRDFVIKTISELPTINLATLFRNKISDDPREQNIFIKEILIRSINRVYDDKCDVKAGEELLLNAMINSFAETKDNSFLNDAIPNLGYKSTPKNQGEVNRNAKIAQFVFGIIERMDKDGKFGADKNAGIVKLLLHATSNMGQDGQKFIKSVCEMCVKSNIITPAEFMKRSKSSVVGERFDSLIEDIRKNVPKSSTLAVALNSVFPPNQRY